MPEDLLALVVDDPVKTVEITEAWADIQQYVAFLSGRGISSTRSRTGSLSMW
jgi:hypothetical protein